VERNVRHARLAAVGGLIKVMTAGRPIPKTLEPSTDNGTMTLAELEARLGEDVERGLGGTREGAPDLMR
jgi:hypothetical protein